MDPILHLFNETNKQNKKNNKIKSYDYFLVIKKIYV